MRSFVMAGVDTSDHPQPPTFRARRCIPEFDHHCAWVGCCIGRDNHGRFNTFLWAESAAVALALYHTLTSLSLQSSALMGATSSHVAAAGSSGDNGLTSAQRFGICMALLVFLGLFGLAIGGLLVFHTYLSFTGMNTREVTHKCTGKRTYAHVRHPGGCCTHLAAFHWPGNAEVAAMAEARSVKRCEAGCDMFCSNKVYSCC